MKMLKIIALVGIIAAAGGYEHGMFGIWAMLIRIFGFTALIALLNSAEGGRLAQGKKGDRV